LNLRDLLKLLIIEILNIDNEIKHYEQKLSKIRDEYKNSMIYEWNAIREK
jgi:Mg2+ and Co2+ transporter CorA